MRRWQKNIIEMVTGILVFLVWILPVIWLVFSSFQPSEIIARSEVSTHMTLDNYKEVFERTNVPNFLVNSILVGLAATLLSALIGIPAAYSLARWDTGGQGLAFWILSSRMMPPAVSIIPFFEQRP